MQNGRGFIIAGLNEYIIVLALHPRFIWVYVAGFKRVSIELRKSDNKKERRFYNGVPFCVYLFSIRPQ